MHTATNMKKVFSVRGLIPAIALASFSPALGVLTVVEGANIPIPANFGGVYLDILSPPVVGSSTQLGLPDNAGGNYTISFSQPGGDWDFNFFFGGVGIAHNATVNPYRNDALDNLSAIQALGLGEIINGTTPTAGSAVPLTTPSLGGSGTGSSGGSGVSTSGNHMGSGPGQFTPGEKSYIGFVLDPGTASETFGWISVTFNDDGTDGLIHDFAFRDTPLAVGAIPEPTTALMTLLASMTLLRRRR